MKMCTKCKKDFPIDNFYFNSHNKRYESACKACMMIKIKEYSHTQRKIRGTYAWWYRRFWTIRRRAKIRKITFGLSLDEFKFLRSGEECFYCKSKFSFDGFEDMASIDRRDNNMGYTLKNCVLCCRLCNLVKGNLFLEEEMSLIGKAVSLYKIRRDQTKTSR